MSKTRLTIKDGKSALVFSDEGVETVINGHIIIDNKASHSIITLPETDREGNIPFRRHLAIDHEKIYFYGNSCGSCPFMFQKVGKNKIKLTPQDVTEILKQGPKAIGVDLIQAISKIVPDGKYKIGYFEVDLEEVTNKSRNDPIAEMVWAAHEDGGPKTKYYRSKKVPINSITNLFELVLPLFSDNELHSQTIREYKRLINKGSQPTALAISIVQQRICLMGPGGEVPTDICLTHFLLDGHHKIKAASKMKRPIKLLSFLYMDENLGGVYALEDKLYGKAFDVW